MKKILNFIGILILLVVVIFLAFLSYLAQKTNRPFLYFPKLATTAVTQKNVSDNLNLMILGLDRRNDWLEKTETTDTIIFSQINFSQNKISLFSFPRDLWDYSSGAKINQIYPSSLSLKNNQEKFSYISEKFTSISGQPIDRVIVLSTENLKKLADILGGIDIFLKTGFKDEKYPNQDYINNPNSGAPIYKTIEFNSGWVHLDSHNITEFVRSRKSADTAAAGGTDLGRIDRQQQLINALIDKLRNSLSQNPQLIFSLYKYWATLEKNISDTELATYFFKYGLKLINIKIIRYPISSGEDPEENLLYHPQRFINSQWVFIPQDKDYRRFQEYISQSLI